MIENHGNISISITGTLLGECVERKQYYAGEAEALKNSVITLQEWGDLIIKQSKESE